MTHNPIRRFGIVLLLSGVAAATAQERQVGPMPSLAPLIERVAPAVVNISVTEVVPSRGRGGQRFEGLEDLFGGRQDRPPRERYGAGSGVIVDAEHGYVLTNHHVVEDASEILVTLVDNRSFEATIVGTDSHSDLAVLQIENRNLTEIPITTGDDLKVGDYVVAIGNPFGFSNTVTGGIVSGLGREFIEDPEGDYYQDFIQTDASINPGNSGGALVNLNGELVGINSAIISQTGGNVGIGFAIPADMVASVMNRLLEYGEVRRGLLGVNIDSVTPSFAEDYGLNVQRGALVMFVAEDSAADKAGIRINDVITSVGGKSVADSNELRNTVAMLLPGEEVDFQVVRGGRERTFRAILDLNEDTSSGQPAAREPRQIRSVFEGLELTEVPERSGGPGLRITNISANRDELGLLLPGDLITAINQRPVGTITAANAIAEEARTIVLEIQRESSSRLVRLR